jgi:hypothetical protein
MYLAPIIVNILTRLVYFDKRFTFGASK